jgi:predicted nucleic acid-binding protein
MPTSDDLALVDTNVIVYAFHQEAEHHTACRSLLDQAQDGQLALCVVSQVLAEFYAIVTDPRQIAQPRQPKQAHRPLTTSWPCQACAAGRLICWPLETWHANLRYRGAIFDLQLVAAMLGNGSDAHTFDTEDFARFSELEVLTP